MKSVLLLFLAFPAALLLQTSKNDIATQLPVPENVNVILKKACNDCHSNTTEFPWYAKIPGVSSYIKNHIEEGREELDFSEFAAYPPYKQFHKLEEIEDEVNQEKMPPKAYILLHEGANLTDAERTVLINWSAALRDTLKARYSAESLVRPKKRK